MSHPLEERVSHELAGLPQEDLPLVLEFLELLKKTRKRDSAATAKVAILRKEARRRAKGLEGLPRSEIASRFAKLAEEIRQAAVHQGTAVDGDWEGD